MITIKIGTSERSYDHIGAIDESWINQQINGLLRDNQAICVRVQIREGDVNMTLATPGCTGAGRGSRPPNTSEQRVFDLWERLGLSKTKFQGGNIIAFLKQARNIVG
jgi:hypothetical protein